jgi:hypothetical protein
MQRRNQIRRQRGTGARRRVRRKSTIYARYAGTPRMYDIESMDTRRVVMAWDPSSRGGSLCIADDDSCSFFAEHSPFLGLGAPISAFLAGEKAKHAGRLLCIGILYERRALISHIGPGAGLVENYLYAPTHTGTALRSSARVGRPGE